MKQELIDQERIHKIKNYYNSCQLWLPNKPQWRSWKAKLPNGTYKRFHLKNEKELRKILVKFTPTRVYYSSVAIYNIRNVKGKITKNTIIPVFKDSIIDLDNPNFEDCRKSTTEVINQIGIIPSYILKTYKGIHICYYKQRINPNLIKGIKDFDVHTLENEYNEFSCPLTLNKGKVCNFITYNQLLNTPTSELEAEQQKIYEFQYDNIGGLEISERKDDQGIKIPSSQNVSNKMQSKLDPLVTPPNPREPEVLLSFNNQVKHQINKGIYIPILIYDKSFKRLKNEIDNLNKLYNLGDILAFESNNYYAFLSLRCFEKKQLQKLLNQSSSITKIQQKKFSKIWLNISEYQLMGIIRYKTNKYFRASLKHFNYFKDCGIKLTIDEFVGHPKLKVYEVYMK